MLLQVEWGVVRELAWFMMKLILLLLAGWCGAGAMRAVAAETPVPKEVWVGTDSLSGKQFQPRTAASPQAFAGMYAAESGDGTSTAMLRIAPVVKSDGSKSWVLAGELEERVAGKKPVRKLIKSTPLRQQAGFWVFKLSKTQGVFVKRQATEFGVILEGTYLGQVKR